LLQILKSETLFKITNQLIAIKEPASDTDSPKILLLTKNKFIYKNKDSFILNITDLTNLKRVNQLQNQNDLLNLMTANVSHEIDTPLNCIICLAEKIIKKSKSEEER